MNTSKNHGWLVYLLASSVVSFFVALFVLERVYAPHFAGHRRWIELGNLVSAGLILTGILNLVLARQPIRAAVSGVLVGLAVALLVISSGISAQQ